jgi:hypothetical protein
MDSTKQTPMITTACIIRGDEQTGPTTSAGIMGSWGSPLIAAAAALAGTGREKGVFFFFFFCGEVQNNVSQPLYAQLTGSRVLFAGRERLLFLKKNPPFYMQIK